ncbi:LacI family DNA-binding transcriptional regulator [Salinicoccus hispanicus]|uniref:Substrate-binding domain-containing protein n=1 Tax=Salinicoccus hispanicus TaxID=157225 RepID=A0A6N8TZZ2_9STAP|nr:LacI family DNA-binding transcriptional regulator [Salinicoccus hispanicus]MXQ51380.1 substrate-binding domain-containing protein [Salinicoccus hispanicus]
MNRTTMADVAAKAKVSKTTVSHFINENFSYMGEETKKRIAEAIEELNYNPNIVAKSLKQKQTMSIGIIVANILHAFSTEVIRSIEDYAHMLGYHVIVCNADDDSEKEKNYISMLLAKQVDGLIVVPTAGNNALFSSLSDDDYPIVFIDRYIEDVPIPAFLTDNSLVIKKAYNHLIEKGHKSIGFISQDVSKGITPRIERYSAYKEMCSAYGITPYLISEKLEKIKDAVLHEIERNRFPKSVIVGNDLALYEVMRAIKEKELEIPQDLSLISIDNVTFTEFFSPGVTVIEQPTSLLGREAADHLFKKINNERIDYVIKRLKPELVERESVYEL